MSGQVDYMTQKLKKTDVFGSTVNLTFQGGKFYTTWCGTMLTNSLNVIVLFYGAFFFVDLYYAMPIAMYDEKLWFDQHKEANGFDFGSAGFDFGVAFTGTDAHKVDSRYGSWTFTHHTVNNTLDEQVKLPPKSSEPFYCNKDPKHW
jgi:hypothetical protein